MLYRQLPSCWWGVKGDNAMQPLSLSSIVANKKKSHADFVCSRERERERVIPGTRWLPTATHNNNNKKKTIRIETWPLLLAATFHPGKG